MKELEIPKIEDLEQFNTSELKSWLTQYGAEASIDGQLWKAYKVTNVTARVFAGFYAVTLVLFYEVHEPEIRAVHTGVQQQVCEDSCVECFIADTDTNRYINFEFNPAGACLAGIGTDRYDRQPAADSALKQIRIWSSFLEEGKPKGGSWELLVLLSLDCFGLLEEKRNSLAGLKLPGNLHKCGDMLKSPHYLTWNRIKSPEPDFHRKEFFGKFIFCE